MKKRGGREPVSHYQYQAARAGDQDCFCARPIDMLAGMPQEWEALVPQPRHEAVARALRTAFDTTALDDIRPLTVGLSTALVFRIDVRGRPYVLRVIMRTDAIADPTAEFACMTAGADAGVAPPVRYTHVADRVSIIDFIEPRTFPADAAALVARTIARVHALPAFHKRYDYLDAMAGFVQRFASSGLVPDRSAGVLRIYDDLIRIYPRHAADQVSSHTDVKADNMLFDGARLWLVDWEAANLNDRYVDLAIAGNFFVDDTDAAARAYVAAYAGEAPGDYRMARFVVMRALVHIFYAAFLLPLAASSGASTAVTDAPPFRDFHRRLLSGEIDIKTADLRWQYGLTHLDRALAEGGTARLREAAALVARGDAAA